MERINRITLSKGFDCLRNTELSHIDLSLKRLATRSSHQNSRDGRIQVFLVNQKVTINEPRPPSAVSFVRLTIDLQTRQSDIQLFTRYLITVSVD